MQDLHHVSVVQPLLVNKCMRKRANMHKLYKKMNLASAVLHSEQTIQDFLKDGLYSSAIEFIESTQRVVANELYDLVCFKYVIT